MNNNKSRGLTVLFSLFPGAGHMYLGYFKRGLELMTIFLLGIFLTSWLNINIFIIVSILAWFYSVFDALNRTYSAEPVKDDDIPIFSFLNGDNWNRQGSKIAGIILVVIGVLCLVEKIIFPITDEFIGWEIRNYIETGIIAALFIAGGVKLLLGSKRRRE